MIIEWTADPLTLAAACGTGTGLVTLARRLGLAERFVGRRVSRLQRVQHALSGCVLAGAVGAGVCLLIGDLWPAERKIGMCLLSSAIFDLGTSEGRWLLWDLVLNSFADTLRKRQQSQPDTENDASTSDKN